MEPEVSAHPLIGSGRSSDLAAELIHDAQRLVRLEVALAKQEVKEIATANAVAAGIVVFGGVLMLLGVLVAIPTFVVVLVPWHWEAAAIWAAAYLLLGLGLALFGKSRFAVRLPNRTLDSLKESKEWVLRRMRSTVR